MRRFGIVVTVGLLALSLAPAAVAAGPNDFAAGGGTHLADGVGPTVNTFSVSAHSASTTGGAAWGSVVLKVHDGGGQPVKGDVTCLWVVGNSAYVTATMTSPKDQAGQRVVVQVVDQGNPVDGVSPDLVRFSWEPFIYPAQWAGGPAGCYLPTLAPVPMIDGNVVVNDAG